jgi:hypothetical protein
MGWNLPLSVQYKIWLLSALICNTIVEVAIKIREFVVRQPWLVRMRESWYRNPILHKYLHTLTDIT